MAYYDIYTTATITADTEAVLPHVYYLHDGANTDTVLAHHDMFVIVTMVPTIDQLWHIMSCLLLLTWES